MAKNERDNGSSISEKRRGTKNRALWDSKTLIKINRIYFIPENLIIQNSRKSSFD